MLMGYKPCLDCGSDWIEENSIFEDKIHKYFVKCNYCRNESSKTPVQNAAKYIWNLEQVDEFYVSCLKDKEKELSNKLEELERDIDDYCENEGIEPDDYDYELSKMKEEFDEISEKLGEIIDEIWDLDVCENFSTKYIYENGNV